MSDIGSYSRNDQTQLGFEDYSDLTGFYSQQQPFSFSVQQFVDGASLVPAGFAGNADSRSNVTNIDNACLPLTQGDWGQWSYNGFGSGRDPFAQQDMNQLHAIQPYNSRGFLYEDPVAQELNDDGPQRIAACVDVPCLTSGERSTPTHGKAPEIPACNNSVQSCGNSQHKNRKTQRQKCQKVKHVAMPEVNLPLDPQAGAPRQATQGNPDDITIAVCHLWLLKHPATMPSEHAVSCLSFLFGAPIETVRHWFLRNLQPNSRNDDTGYQTMASSDIDIAANYRGNRGECNRKGGKTGNPGPLLSRSAQFGRDEARPYACTSRCGATFKKKSAWKRHEEINRPPRMWLCNFQACREKSERNRVFFRKDHFRKHLSRDHEGVVPRNRDISACCIPIKSNFSVHCIFRNCSKKFRRWKDRIDHIADHLRKPWEMSEWRESDDGVESAEASDGGASDSDEPKSDATTNNGNFSDSDDSADDGQAPSNTESNPDTGSGNKGSKPSGGRNGDGNGSYRPPSADNGAGFSGSAHNFRFGLQSCDPAVLNDTSAPESSSFNFVQSSRWQSRESRSHELVLCLLASGTGAAVDGVVVESRSHTVARKRSRSRPTNRRHAIAHEALMIAKLKYPLIARYMASYMEADSVTILIEPVQHCTLLQYVNTDIVRRSTGQEMWAWFSCLSSALAYLHRSGVHFFDWDIKPRNILIKDRIAVFADFEYPRWTSKTANFITRFAAQKLYWGKRGRAADIFALGYISLEVSSVLGQNSFEHVWEEPVERSCHTMPCPSPNTDSTIGFVQRLPQNIHEQPDRGTQLVSTLLYAYEKMMRSRPEDRLTAADVDPRYTLLSKANGTDIKIAAKENRDRILTMSQDCVEDSVPALCRASSEATLSDASSTSAWNSKSSFETAVRGHNQKTTVSGSSLRPRLRPLVVQYGIPTPKESPSAAKAPLMMETYLQDIDKYQRWLVTGESEFAEAAKKASSESATTLE